MTRWFLIVLTGGSLALSGCSLSLSGPARDRPRGKAPECDTSKGLVFADALIASTLGIVAVSVASSNGGEAVLPLIGAGVFVASAIHGNNVVNACNREIGNYNSEQLAADRPPLPEEEPQRPVVAMQPQPAPQPQPSPQPQLSPQPQPQPASQPQLQPPPQPQRPPPPQQQRPTSQAAASEWAAFWKESP